MEKKKVGFASGVGFILAAAGSAVGLGNLWGFPYKTSQNGGAAFVLIYIACVLLIGFVTMLSEIYLGRRAQANPMTAYKMIHKNLGWCGLVAIVIPALIICYYSVLGGWTTKYALNSFSGNAGIVGTFSVNTGEVILYTAIFLVLSMVIIMGGVKDGIEKASKVLMPVLFLILVAIAVYALTLGSGVREGLQFYLKPDFSGITFKSVLVAMGQAFYSLSLGMGIMITYGSYTGKEVNLVRSTAMICVFDTLVALIAGLAIFPSVAHFDPALLGSSKGVALMFIILPQVFESMGGVGQVVSFAFFVMVDIAAITSVVSLIEVVTQFVIQKFHAHRKRAALIVASVCFVVSIPIGISLGHVAILEEASPAHARVRAVFLHRCRLVHHAQARRGRDRGWGHTHGRLAQEGLRRHDPLRDAGAHPHRRDRRPAERDRGRQHRRHRLCLRARGAVRGGVFCLLPQRRHRHERRREALRRLPRVTRAMRQMPRHCF